MRRLAAWVATVLAVVLLAGPASATDAPTPSPTAASSDAATPTPTPTDGIRELPTADEGANFYSVATVLLFFAIAMGVFVFIIRAGMRSADRED